MALLTTIAAKVDGLVAGHARLIGGRIGIYRAGQIAGGYVAGRPIAYATPCGSRWAVKSPAGARLTWVDIPRYLSDMERLGPDACARAIAGAVKGLA